MLKFKVTKKRSANIALEDGCGTRGTTKTKPSQGTVPPLDGAPELKDTSHCCGVSVTSKDSDIGSLSTENDAQECSKSVRSDGSSVCSSGFQEKKADSFEDSTYTIESSQSSSSGIVSDDHHHDNGSTSNLDDCVFFNQSASPDSAILPASRNRRPGEGHSSANVFERRLKARLPIRKTNPRTVNTHDDSDHDYTGTVVDMSHDSSSGVESGDPQPTARRKEYTANKLGLPQSAVSAHLAPSQNEALTQPHRRDLSWSTCSDSDIRSGSVFSSSDTDNNARYRNLRSTHQPIIGQPGRQTPTMHQQRGSNPPRTFKSAPLKSKKHVTFQAANGIDPLGPCGEDTNQNKHYQDSNILYYEDEGEFVNDQYYNKQAGQHVYGEQDSSNPSHGAQRVTSQQAHRLSPNVTGQSHRQSPLTTSQAHRQSPLTTSQAQRQSPVTTSQAHRQSPLTTSQVHRQSPLTTSQTHRQSPMTTSQAQRQSPLIMLQNQRRSPVVMLQNQRQTPVVETAHAQRRQGQRVGVHKQTHSYHQHQLSSGGDDNSGYQGSEDDDVTTDTSSEHHVPRKAHEISRYSPSPRSLTPVPNGSEKMDQKKKSKLSYFEKLPDDVLVRIFSHLPSDRLCSSARVCRRWYILAYEPSLWTCIRINSATVNADKALKVLTRRLSYDTPSVCVMVEKINLNGCEMLSDKGLNTIAKRCPELRHLEMTGCPNVSNIALFELVSRCVNLEHLNTSGCENITCISLTPQATVQAQTYGKQIDLRYLDMSDCVHLEDSGLQIIASYCSQLVHLYLRRCVKVTDIGVQYVANYCANLKEFSICDCKNVTDFGLKELSKLGSNLRYLSAAKCCKITDSGVKAIARSCHRLRYLNVRGCEGVSDDAIETLSRNCPRLRSLDIGKCDVTDDSLHVLAEHCAQLRKLSLKSCDAITDKGITSVAERCRQLQQLNIQECHLTVNAYRTVKALCKKCIIEHTNPGFY